MDKVLVAVDARTLCDPSIPRFNLNRVFEAANGEGQRMKEAVVGLCHPFTDRVVRKVAIVADGDMMVAALLPGIHVVLHHMAIHTRLRIVAQVAGPLTIAKRKRTNPGKNAKRHCKSDRDLAKS